MEVVGDAPVFVAALTTDRPSIHVAAQDADRMLFIFVEMRQRTLEISADSETYRLADGNDVDCRLTLEWRVTDAEQFWNGSKDPVASLRARVVATTREYFTGLTSDRLLEDASHVERGLVDRIFDRALTLVKNGLETHVHQHATVPGVKIDRVSVLIEPSTELTDHLRRLRDKVFGEGGILDRSKTDRLLEVDQTYAPYKVRDVARFLDMRLLENFYSRPWQEAMDALAVAFETRKAELQPKDRLTTIEDALERAQRAELEDVYILELKDKYADALKESLNGPDTRSAISDQAFLATLLGPPTQPTAQVGFNASVPRINEDPDRNQGDSPHGEHGG